MKIKLAILHRNQAYLNRFASLLEAKFSDKLSLYCFTDLTIAQAALHSEKIDVFLSDDSFPVELSELPPQCGFAYLVDSPDISAFNGKPAICRYQRLEFLYKQILGVFSDAVGASSVRNLYSSAAKTILFSSPCGGVGTSSMACACAASFAAQGKKVLYLNLENFGGADLYINGDGMFDMSDIVYAVKSGHSNLEMKLDSCVRCDAGGVYYFAMAKVALDMMELNGPDREKLLETLSGSGKYDYIIADMDFSLAPEMLSVFGAAHVIVWVSDARIPSQAKIQRAFQALCVLDQDSQEPLAERVCVLINKAPENPGAVPPLPGMRVAGMLPRLRHREGERVFDKLAQSSVFNAILGS